MRNVLKVKMQRWASKVLAEVRATSSLSVPTNSPGSSLVPSTPQSSPNRIHHSTTLSPVSFPLYSGVASSSLSPSRRAASKSSRDLSKQFRKLHTRETGGDKTFTDYEIGDLDPKPFKFDLDNISSLEDAAQFEDLLLNDVYIDKSKVLWHLLSSRIRREPLLLVYCRRFSKSVTLQTIRAVFSGLSKWGQEPMQDIKSKILALECGQQLLELGARPVVFISMDYLEDVDDLRDRVRSSLQNAGLREEELAAAFNTDMNSKSPTRLLRKGGELLQKKFQNETGQKRSPVLLVDEYDRPFRSRDSDAALLEEVRTIYSSVKHESSPFGLTCFAGLTRMVGVTLSDMNNFLDVSQQVEYHGVCGLSAGEITRSIGGQLDNKCQNYWKMSLEDFLQSEMVKRSLNGFQFGFDGEETGVIDPKSPGGSLYSPIDISRLLKKLKHRGKGGVDGLVDSKWIYTMHAEFEFASFAAKYKDNFHTLSKLLDGGTITRGDLLDHLKREDYMTLRKDEHVLRVLLELGLLSVQSIDGSTVTLGSPNEFVREKALELLVSKVLPPEPSLRAAQEYLGEEHMSKILADVEKTIDEKFRDSDVSMLRESDIEQHICLEMQSYLPHVPDCPYDVRRQASTDTNNPKKKLGISDISATLSYPELKGKKEVYLYEIKCNKKLENPSKEQIKEAHEGNHKEAMEQVGFYSLPKTISSGTLGVDYDMTRFSISAVWYKDGDVRKSSMEIKKQNK